MCIVLWYSVTYVGPAECKGPIRFRASLFRISFNSIPQGSDCEVHSVHEVKSLPIMPQKQVSTHFYYVRIGPNKGNPLTQN